MRSNRILGIVITLAVIFGFSIDVLGQSVRTGRLILKYMLEPKSVSTSRQATFLLAVQNTSIRTRNTLQPGDSIRLIMPIGNTARDLAGTNSDLSCVSLPDPNAWKCEILEDGIKFSVIGDGFPVGNAGSDIGSFFFVFGAKVNPLVGLAHLKLDHLISRRRARARQRNISFYISKLPPKQTGIQILSAEPKINYTIRPGNNEIYEAASLEIQTASPGTILAFGSIGCGMTPQTSTTMLQTAISLDGQMPNEPFRLYNWYPEGRGQQDVISVTSTHRVLAGGQAISLLCKGYAREGGDEIRILKARLVVLFIPD